MDDCIGYFFAKKVDCLPRSELKPVKFNAHEPRSFHPRSRAADDQQKSNTVPRPIVKDICDNEEQLRMANSSTGNPGDSPLDSSIVTEQNIDVTGRDRPATGGVTSHSAIPSSVHFEGVMSSSYDVGSVNRFVNNQTLEFQFPSRENCNPAQVLFNRDNCCRGRGRGILFKSQESRSPGVDCSVLTISGDVECPDADDVVTNLAPESYGESLSYESRNESTFSQRSCFDQLDDDVIIESCTEEVIEDDDVAPETGENANWN